jgi:tripartite ATP-independent transporter DctM subunit
MVLLLLTAAVVLLILLRVPVAFALLIPGVGYILMTPGLSMVAALQRTVAGLDIFALLAVPLFIMAGNASNESGITDRLFTVAENLLGHIRGSLGYVNVAVSVLFSWMSGAAISDAAALGKLEVPAMVKRGYDESFAVGITAASTTIGPVMPPSIPAVIYAVTASVSVGGLFLAGVLPAALIAVSLCVSVYLYARKRPELRIERSSTDAIARSILAALLPLGAPVIIIGGILGGYFTPTEAAGVAVAYMVLLGVVYGALRPAGVYRMLESTAEATGSVMLIVASASLFGFVLAMEQAPQVVASALLSFTDNPILFLALVNVLLLLVGTLLEPTSAILILVPVLSPAAASFGIDPLHFGVVVIFNLMIGLLTPPVGLVLYVLSSATDIPFGRVVKGTLPFLVPLFAVLVLLTYIPNISLFLPRLMGLR